jgi:hypothetical protein
VLDSHKAPYWTIVEGLTFVNSVSAPRKTIIVGTISDYPGADRHDLKDRRGTSASFVSRALVCMPRA